MTLRDIQMILSPQVAIFTISFIFIGTATNWSLIMTSGVISLSIIEQIRLKSKFYYQKPTNKQLLYKDLNTNEQFAKTPPPKDINKYCDTYDTDNSSGSNSVNDVR